MAQRLKLGLCKAIATTLQSCTSTDTSDPPLPTSHSSLPNSNQDDKWQVVCGPHKPNAGRRRRKKKRKHVPNRIHVSSDDSSEIDTLAPKPIPARLSVFKKMIPCAVDGKVKESFAVVKRSEDPYEDFKNSMVEMIVEKQMFEQRDLEQLLQCFLSLNSRRYHGIIVQAFSHIWDTIFNYAL